MFILILLIIVLLAAAAITFYLLLHTHKRGLRVLMYHFTPADGEPDALTVTAPQLEEQFRLLKETGYECVSMSMVLDHIRYGKKLPANSVLLSFDDGYKNNYTVLYPLLQKHGISGTIFLVPDYINRGEAGDPEYMTMAEIKSCDPAVLEFGYHTYSHKSYKALSLEEIEKDIKATRQWFIENDIRHVPAWAYTYGDYPKKDTAKKEKLFRLFAENNIHAAFCIEERVNSLPLKKKYTLQRLDIKGSYSGEKFLRKLRSGKVIRGVIRDMIGKT